VADWADEKGLMIYEGYTNTPKGIAAALRQARLDALEEAESAAKMYVGCERIAADIRSLKEKQP
jgi:hypothetical protein